jgi:alpha(1,3/1,4) fucosyltransferase
MLDPRTADILARTLHIPAPDARALDRQLLHGPDEARVRVRPPLSIAFYDFWPEFNKARNFFTEILSSRFQLRAVTDDADLAVYSVFGTAHRAAKARRKLFYTGECRRPPLDDCDMAASFDYLDDARHYRLPLYVMHAYDHVREGATPAYSNPLLPPSVEDLSREAFEARKFCAFLYKNPHPPRRNAFFQYLNERRRVDSLGWHLNNTGTVVKTGWTAKIRVLARYRCAFAFENESHPGYVTEKALDAFQAGAVPLYWGCPEAAREINPDAFIDLTGCDDDAAAAARVLEVADDYDRWRACRETPPYLGRQDFYFDAYRLAEWIAERL